MKARNSIFFLTLMTVFLSSCSTTAIDIDKTALLEPESFIAERKDAIEQTVALGPQIIVDLEQQQQIKDNERREINKEERKNNIDVSSGQNGTFPVTVNFENTGKKVINAKEIILEKVNKIESVPKELTLNEKVDITKTSLKSMYSNREDKRFYDYGGVTYDFIKRNNLLVFSTFTKL